MLILRKQWLIIIKTKEPAKSGEFIYFTMKECAMGELIRRCSTILSLCNHGLANNQLFL